MRDDNDRQRTVDLGDDELPGEDLRSMCLEAGGALTVRGGRITGDLDLTDLALGRHLTFVDTVFTKTIRLTSTSCRSLEFTGCSFLGGLDATAVRIDGNFKMTGCSVSGLADGTEPRRPAAVWLTDARVSGRLEIINSTIGRADDNWSRSIHADRIEVGAGVSIVDGVQAHGEIKLTGAGIGGSVNIYGASIEDPYVALYLSEARIGGNLFVMDDQAGNPSVITGGLVASGAIINGQCLLYKAQVRAPAQANNPRYWYRGARSGVAIDATRARFDGDLRMYGGTEITGKIDLATATVESQLDLDDTTVHEPESGWLPETYAINLSNAKLGSDFRFHGHSGSVRLENANVAGSLHFEDVTIDANQPEAIEARNVRVEGDVWLDNARITNGDTDFRLSHVAGDWRARGAQLSPSGAPGAAALTLTSSEIDGSVFLNHGFTSVGLLHLNRCRIGGRLTFEGATIRPAENDTAPLVVACRSTTVASGLFLDWDVEGNVDFQGTSTDLLVDDPSRWGTGHVIAGLTYQRMTPVNSDPTSTANELDRRLAWLADQGEPDAGTYSLLADYYRRHGHTIDAEEVLIARNRFLRTERQTQGGWRNRLRNITDILWDVGVGYGYRSSRAALMIVALTAVTSILLHSNFARDRLVTIDEDNTVYVAAEPCESGTVRCFSPVFYAVDTVIPLVDLQQRSTWYPAHNLRFGSALEWGLDFTVLLGWGASSALVLGLSRSLAPDR